MEAKKCIDNAIWMMFPGRLTHLGSQAPTFDPPFDVHEDPPI